LLCYTSIAQNKSNRGKEFWLGYGHNSLFNLPAPVSNQINHQTLSLYIYAEEGATVTVSINGTSWSQTVTIPVGGIDASIIIPKTGTNDARLTTEGLSTKGIHVVANNPIVVYMHQHEVWSSGAAMLMPVEAYGYNYKSVNITQSSNETDSYSWMFVVANENNTRVQITPSDSTEGGWLPTQTYTVNLNKGEIYNLFGKLTGSFNGKDLTGTKVVSVAGGDGICHPIAMFCGSSRNTIQNTECIGNFYPTIGTHINGNGGEMLMQQMFPANAWGTKYLTYHIVNNTSSDLSIPFKNLYRIAVQDPSTIVKRNGTVLTGLINNYFYDISSYGGDVIEADKPILVAQFLINNYQCSPPPSIPSFSTGDPEMIFLSPIEQGVKSTKCFETRNSNTNSIGLVYIQAIVKTAGLNSMLIDGAPIDPHEHILHPQDNSYSVIARKSTIAGAHVITCDSSFVGMIYGQGNWESYGYNIGCLVNNLNTYSQIKNTLNTNNKIDTFTCVKSPFRPVAKVAYRLTNMHWKLTQTAGLISNNADSIITNPTPADSSFVNGRKYYHYTLQQDFTFNTPGTYTLPISYSAPDIDACNNTEEAAIIIRVKPAPVANFNISAQQCLSDTVRFTGTTATENGLFNYVNYLWNFEDATSQTLKDAKKRFTTAGTHTVRYRVYADNGCIGDTTKTISITNGTGPQIGFTINGKYCADSTLSFSSAIPASTNTSYWWDFGDGQIQTTNNNTIVHQYTAATNTIVRHTATITNGCNPDTAQQTITAINNNPSAVPFTATGDTLCINKPIQINATSNGVTKWNWNFGAGTGAQVPPFIYNYSNAGSYTINLTITDGNGCGSPISTQPINIAPNPVVSAGPDKFVPFNSSTTLDATLINAANYNINWQPVTYLNNSNILTPISTPGQSPITYTIQVTDKISLCTGWDKVIITPISKLYIPTAFTPNNNGKNEKWEIIGMALYPEGIVTIYNRWGEKIFESKKYYQNAWNGTYKGQLQPIGSYIYVIQLNDATKQVLKGTVTIIK
jgi:gliding motility-associated-like protein